MLERKKHMQMLERKNILTYVSQSAMLHSKAEATA